MKQLNPDLQLLLITKRGSSQPDSGLPPDLAHIHKLFRAQHSRLARDSIHIRGVKMDEDYFVLTKSKLILFASMLRIITRNKADPEKALQRLTLIQSGTNPFSRQKSVRLLEHRNLIGKILYFLTFTFYRPKSARLVDHAIKAYQQHLAPNRP